MNCFNGEIFLQEAIESVLKQNYKNWELIFWDNKSIDNSKKILFTFKDKRIKYFYSNKNIKLYEARNKAIKKASGKYITFLDVDDFWKKKKLENQLRIFKKDDSINFIYSNYFVYYNKTKKKKLFYSKNLPSGYITQKLLDAFLICISTVMMKKKIFENDLFNKNYEIIGDFDYFIKLSMKIKFYAIQKPLTIYRIHEYNTSKIKLNLYINELNSWIKKYEKKFKNLNIFISGQKTILRKQKIKRLLLKYF